MSENRVLFENRSYEHVQIMEGKLLFNVQSRLRGNGFTDTNINYIVHTISNSTFYMLVIKTVIIIKLVISIIICIVHYNIIICAYHRHINKRTATLTHPT